MSLISPIHIIIFSVYSVFLSIGSFTFSLLCSYQLTHVAFRSNSTSHITEQKNSSGILSRCTKQSTPGKTPPSKKSPKHSASIPQSFSPPHSSGRVSSSGTSSEHPSSLTVDRPTQNRYAFSTKTSGVLSLGLDGLEQVRKKAGMVSATITVRWRISGLSRGMG